MKILLKRLATYKQCLHGRLYIAGEYVCDTLERVGNCLMPGVYSLSRRKKAVLENKRVLPSFWPTNGSYNLPSGGIAVGEWHHLGYLVHCEASYLPLMERLRLAKSRKTDVTLYIQDAISDEMRF